MSCGLVVLSASCSDSARSCTGWPAQQWVRATSPMGREPKAAQGRCGRWRYITSFAHDPSPSYWPCFTAAGVTPRDPRPRLGGVDVDRSGPAACDGVKLCMAHRDVRSGRSSSRRLWNVVSPSTPRTRQTLARQLHYRTSAWGRFRSRASRRAVDVRGVARQRTSRTSAMGG